MTRRTRWRMCALAASVCAVLCTVIGGTVTGRILLPSGSAYTNTVRFHPVTTPLIDYGYTIATADQTATPDTNGDFSVSLESGRYQVGLQSTRGFLIEVPSGTGTNAIAELVVSGAIAWNSVKVNPASFEIVWPTNFFTANSNLMASGLHSTTTTNQVLYWSTNILGNGTGGAVGFCPTGSVAISSWIAPSTDGMPAVGTFSIDGDFEPIVDLLSTNQLLSPATADARYVMQGGPATNITMIGGEVNDSSIRRPIVYFDSTLGGSIKGADNGSIGDTSIRSSTADGVLEMLDGGGHPLTTLYTTNQLLAPATADARYVMQSGPATNLTGIGGDFSDTTIRQPIVYLDSTLGGSIKGANSGTPGLLQLRSTSADGILEVLDSGGHPFTNLFTTNQILAPAVADFRYVRQNSAATNVDLILPTWNGNQFSDAATNIAGWVTTAEAPVARAALGVSETVTNAPPVIVANVDQLVGYSSTATNITVLGHTTVGDGGGGTFTYYPDFPTLVTGTNLGSVFAKAHAPTGYWVRTLIDGRLPVEACGAFTNDYACWNPIVGAFNAIKTDKRIQTVTASGYGSFYVTNRIWLNWEHNGLTIDMGETWFQLAHQMMNVSDSHFLTVYTSTNPPPGPYSLNLRNISICGLLTNQVEGAYTIDEVYLNRYTGGNVTEPTNTLSGRKKLTQGLALRGPPSTSYPYTFTNWYTTNMVKDSHWGRLRFKNIMGAMNISSPWNLQIEELNFENIPYTAWDITYGVDTNSPAANEAINGFLNSEYYPRILVNRVYAKRVGGVFTFDMNGYYAPQISGTRGGFVTIERIDSDNIWGACKVDSPFHVHIGTWNANHCFPPKAMTDDGGDKYEYSTDIYSVFNVVSTATKMHEGTVRIDKFTVRDALYATMYNRYRRGTTTYPSYKLTFTIGELVLDSVTCGGGVVDRVDSLIMLDSWRPPEIMSLGSWYWNGANSRYHVALIGNGSDNGYGNPDRNIFAAGSGTISATYRNYLWYLSASMTNKASWKMENVLWEDLGPLTAQAQAYDFARSSDVCSVNTLFQHGWTNGQTISYAGPAGFENYSVTNAAITVVNATNFTYVAQYGSGPGYDDADTVSGTASSETFLIRPSYQYASITIPWIFCNAAAGCSAEINNWRWINETNGAVIAGLFGVNNVVQHYTFKDVDLSGGVNCRVALDTLAAAGSKLMAENFHGPTNNLGWTSTAATHNQRFGMSLQKQGNNYTWWNANPALMFTNITGTTDIPAGGSFPYGYAVGWDKYGTGTRDLYRTYTDSNNNDGFRLNVSTNGIIALEATTIGTGTDNLTLQLNAAGTGTVTANGNNVMRWRGIVGAGAGAPASLIAGDMYLSNVTVYVYGTDSIPLN